MPSSKHSRIFFGFTFLVILYVFYRMLEPFLIAGILALTLVCLFYPNYKELNWRLKGRAGLSSIIMCTVITIIIIIPTIVFSIALVQEFQIAYQNFQAVVAQGEVSEPWLDNPMLAEIFQRFGSRLGLQEMSLTLALSSLIDRLAEYLLEHYSAILGGIGSFLLNFGVMIFSMFFFFRDGDRFLNEVKRLIPLQREYEDMLVEKLKQVVYATFFGLFAIGILQGATASIIFALLGLGNPILWGTATALFSLIPVVGTAAIWGPMAAYLILTGSVAKGIVLLILGSTAIGLIDNFIRPLIIERRSRGMHMLLVFFAILGGIALFGPSGLVLGPLIAALLVTFLDIYKLEFQN
ncbi:MAG: AI-2E family transporter [Acidobacteriota bacterium]